MNSTRPDLHKLDVLIDIYETVLYTGALNNANPLSVIFVGPSGSAKSKMLKSYGGPYIHHTDSITSNGIWEIVQRDPKNEIKFIIIPDINPTMARRASTVYSTVGNLLSLTADGTCRTDDGRNQKEMKHSVIGLITACTPEMYDKHARQWFALGLRRRIIPVFYRFSTTTVNELQRLTREGKITSTPSIPKTFALTNGSRPFVSISSATASALQIFSQHFANNLGKLFNRQKSVKKWVIKEVVPIAPHVVLRSLAIAHALRRHSKKVEQTDLDFIGTFVDFTDPESPKQI